MTELVDLSIFYDEIRPECPGVITPEMDRVLLNASIEFCKRTRMWRELEEDYGIFTQYDTINLNDIAANFLTGAKCLDVKGVFLSEDGTPLTLTSENRLNTVNAGWRAETATLPTHHFVTHDKTLRLYPLLTDGADSFDIDIDLVLVPSRTVTQLPEFLYYFWAEYLCAGAKAALMLQPGQTYHNPELSNFNRTKWLAGVFEGCRLVAKKDIDARNARNRQKER